MQYHQGQSTLPRLAGLLRTLDLLRAGHTDYVLNDAAYGYMRTHA